MTLQMQKHKNKSTTNKTKADANASNKQTKQQVQWKIQSAIKLPLSFIIATNTNRTAFAKAV